MHGRFIGPNSASAVVFCIGLIWTTLICLWGAFLVSKVGLICASPALVFGVSYLYSRLDLRRCDDFTMHSLFWTGLAVTILMPTTLIYVTSVV